MPGLGTPFARWCQASRIDGHVVHLHIVAVAELVQGEGVGHLLLEAGCILGFIHGFLGGSQGK